MKMNPIKTNMSSFYFLCRRCGKGKSKYISIPCSKCLNNRKYQKELEEFNKNYKSGRQLVGRYKDIVAFGVEKKTGRFMGLTKKGTYVDPRDTRYAQYPDDVHGWRATGKKVRTYGN